MPDRGPPPWLWIAVVGLLACDGDIAAPTSPDSDAGVSSRAAPAVLADPWVASFLELEDADLRNRLVVHRDREPELSALISTLLKEPAALQSTDLVSLTVIELSLAAESGSSLTQENLP